MALRLIEHHGPTSLEGGVVDVIVFVLVLQE